MVWLKQSLCYVKACSQRCCWDSKGAGLAWHPEETATGNAMTGWWISVLGRAEKIWLKKSEYFILRRGKSGILELMGQISPLPISEKLCERQWGGLSQRFLLLILSESLDFSKLMFPCISFSYHKLMFPCISFFFHAKGQFAEVDAYVLLTFNSSCLPNCFWEALCMKTCPHAKPNSLYSWFLM